LPQGGATPVSLRSADEILALIERAAGDALLLQGERRARAIGYLCSIALKALEIGELEDRLQALEDR
jgi:hypothetical protein